MLCHVHNLLLLNQSTEDNKLKNDAKLTTILSIKEHIFHSIKMIIQISDTRLFYSFN